jgi:hypothetical protein
MNKIAFILLVFCFLCCNQGKLERQDNSSICKSFGNIDKIENSARKLVESLKLNGLFNESQLVLVCCYQKCETSGEVYTINGFRIKLIPIVALKGKIKNPVIYIHLHSPNLSGFGHKENYGKAFLVFLKYEVKSDIKVNENYSEGKEFLRSFKLNDDIY